MYRYVMISKIHYYSTAQYIHHFWAKLIIKKDNKTQANFLYMHQISLEG